MDVFLVEDSAAVLQRLTGLLDAIPGVKIVGHASGVREALAGIFEAKPEVIVLDLKLAQGSGFDVPPRCTSASRASRCTCCPTSPPSPIGATPSGWARAGSSTRPLNSSAYATSSRNVPPPPSRRTEREIRDAPRPRLQTRPKNPLYEDN